MNYVWLGIAIAGIVYLAIGINRSTMIMRAVKHDMRPSTNLEHFGLVLVGIFHVIAWLPYLVAAIVAYRRDHAKL